MVRHLRAARRPTAAPERQPVRPIRLVPARHGHARWRPIRLDALKQPPFVFPAWLQDTYRVGQCPHMPTEELLTPLELAELLKVPHGTIEKWRQRGRGPVYLKIGVHVRYRRSDVEAWLTQSMASHGAA